MRDDGWIKSSYSGGGNNCVELNLDGSAVGVRDSKQGGAGPVLEVTSAALAAFTASINAGEFE